MNLRVAMLGWMGIVVGIASSGCAGETPGGDVTSGAISATPGAPSLELTTKGPLRTLEKNEVASVTMQLTATEASLTDDALRVSRAVITEDVRFVLREGEAGSFREVRVPSCAYRDTTCFAVDLSYRTLPSGDWVPISPDHANAHWTGILFSPITRALRGNWGSADLVADVANRGSSNNQGSSSYQLPKRGDLEIRVLAFPMGTFEKGSTFVTTVDYHQL